MSRAAQRQQGAASLWVILILVLVLVGLLTWMHLGQDSDILDAQRLAELQKAKLPQKPAGMATGEWPQWRGPNRDGLSSATGLLPSWPADLAQLKVWEAKVGPGYSTVVVSQGRVYGFFQDGDSEAVVCWQEGDGKELWRYRYTAHYQNDYGDGPRSTPALDGDRLYTVGGTGIMHCLKTHPATAAGEVIWRKDLLTDFGAENPKWGVSFSPLVVGDLVYITPGGTEGKSVAALDRLTGAVRWQGQEDTAGYSSPVLATVGGQKQVVFFTGKAVLGLTPQEGKLLWRHPWTTSYDVNAATPIIVSDYVFISSGYGSGCTLLQIETKGSGEQQAKVVYKNRRMKNQFSSCVFYQDHLYGFNDSVLTCLDFRTGQVKWDLREGDFDRGSVTLADGKLIILGENGWLALAEATPESYQEHSRYRFSDKRCWSVPVVCNGHLYVRDQEKLWSLDIRKK